MANVKISALPIGSSLDGTELVPIVQAGVTKQTTTQDIADLGGGVGVEGITGDLVDNTDPANPIVNLAGTLGGDRIVNLNGKSLSFNESGNDLLVINPVTFVASLAAADGIDSIVSEIELNADFGTNVSWYLNAYDGVSGATITGDATAKTIVASAGDFQSLYLDGVGFISRLIAQDGTASTTISAQADLANTQVYFQLSTKTSVLGAVTNISGDAIAKTIDISAAGTARIDLDGVAETITMIATNGVTVNGDPALTGSAVASNQILYGDGTDAATSNSNFLWAADGIGSNINSFKISGSNGGGFEMVQGGSTTQGVLYNFGTDIYMKSVSGEIYFQNNGRKVAFGGSADVPHATVDVKGSFSTAYVAKTATYPITAADYTIECTSGTFTTTLPTAVGCSGRFYFITNSGAGTITLATTSSQTFANVVATPTTLTIATLTGVVVQSNGANWLKVSSF